MTEKRFTDDGIEEIENQSFTDNLTGKTYWIDKGLDEIVDLLNALNDENEQLKEEIARQKYTKHIMRENIKSYERAIKRLRKSYEEFDEMRLERIRFLEKRLKRNGLSI